MSRRGIEIELKGLLTPRERIWNAIRKLAPSPFTRMTVQDHCAPMVTWTAVQDYFDALEAGGYIKRSGKRHPSPHTVVVEIEYLLVKNVSDAPRLTRTGEPVTQGQANEAMWRAMKVLPSFDHQDLAQAATLGTLVVRPETAKTYLRHLQRADYLSIVRPARGGQGARPTRYTLIKNTGPQAPAITRRKVVFDRNTGEFANLDTAQEVCDGLV